MKVVFATISFLVISAFSDFNFLKPVEQRKAIIVLTYDDALASQLDIAIPQLDKAKLKGTFFLNLPASEEHIDKWKAAAKSGHELGNHTMYHPCMSNKIPTDPHYHSENYNTHRIIREITAMNKFLYALDGKLSHSYAYPCCETSVGGESYVEELRKSGVSKFARTCGSGTIMQDKSKTDLMLIPSMPFTSKESGEQLISYVKSVQKVKGVGVLLFHGVGGDYLEVTAEAHEKLLNYLIENKNEISVMTFEAAMKATCE